jgi:hypothetical protein
MLSLVLKVKAEDKGLYPKLTIDTGIQNLNPAISE